MEKTGPEYGPFGTPVLTVLSLSVFRSHPSVESQPSRPRLAIVAARWASLRKLRWTTTGDLHSSTHMASVIGVCGAGRWGGASAFTHALRKRFPTGGRLCTPPHTPSDTLTTAGPHLPVVVAGDHVEHAWLLEAAETAEGIVAIEVAPGAGADLRDDIDRPATHRPRFDGQRRMDRPTANRALAARAGGFPGGNEVCLQALLVKDVKTRCPRAPLVERSEADRTVFLRVATHLSTSEGGRPCAGAGG